MTQHYNAVHSHRSTCQPHLQRTPNGGDVERPRQQTVLPQPPRFTKVAHPIFSGQLSVGPVVICEIDPTLFIFGLGLPCDSEGAFLLNGVPRRRWPYRTDPAAADWAPFQSRAAFELAELLYTKVEMSEGNMDELMEIWAATLVQHSDTPVFANSEELLTTIDEIAHGEVAWECFDISYNGARPDADEPPWMNATHRIWYRDPRQLILNMLANPDFAGRFDFAPFQEFSDEDGSRQWRNFMSGNWSWRNAVCERLL